MPKNIKKVINKKGHIYSETLSNWKYIVGENLFEFAIQSHLKIQIIWCEYFVNNGKKGHEVDMEYSKKKSSINE